MCTREKLDIQTLHVCIEKQCYLCSTMIPPPTVNFIAFEFNNYKGEMFPFCFRCLDLYVWECDDDSHQDSIVFHLHDSK